MPLTIQRVERRDGADRNELGHTALAFCRAVRSADGVHSSRFYWANADTIAIITESDAGAYGPGSGAESTPEGARAGFALSDLARQLSTETLIDARAGEQNYKLAQ